MAIRRPLCGDVAFTGVNESKASRSLRNGTPGGFLVSTEPDYCFAAPTLARSSPAIWAVTGK